MYHMATQIHVFIYFFIFLHPSCLQQITSLYNSGFTLIFFWNSPTQTIILTGRNFSMYQRVCIVSSYRFAVENTVSFLGSINLVSILMDFCESCNRVVRVRVLGASKFARSAIWRRERSPNRRFVTNYNHNLFIVPVVCHQSNT